MHRDNYGQLIFSEEDLCEQFMLDPEKQLQKVLTDCNINFDSNLDLVYKPKLLEYVDPKVTVQEFDIVNQSIWLMPDDYKNLDVAQYILDKCTNDSELQRAGQELLLYQDNNMFDLLKYLKYLVDTMRANNIVWGVGRGSSVASFVLYLLGVHKINSLYYDLPVEEFFKSGAKNA